VDVPARVSDVLANVLDERDDVVMARRLDLGDPLDVECRLLLDLGQIFDRDLAEPHASLDGQHLDLEPAGELGTLREDRRHLLTAVPGYHEAHPTDRSDA
jgi:hypothetical protein